MKEGFIISSRMLKDHLCDSVREILFSETCFAAFVPSLCCLWYCADGEGIQSAEHVCFDA